MNRFLVFSALQNSPFSLKKWQRHGLLLLMLPMLLTCTQLQNIVNMQKPSASVAGARITGISFSDLQLMFDINVENPNAVGITLNSFDYGLKVNDNNFLTGDNQEGLSIPANGGHTINLPLSLNFKDLYNTFAGIKSQDSSTFELDAGFGFDVPVLGTVRVPVKKSGFIPLPKLPSIKLGSVKLNKLNLTSADLEININVDNPNAFAMSLNKLNYKFDVNGQTWGLGESARAMQIIEKGQGVVSLPISLNFLQIGRSVYQLLNGGGALDYRLSGDADLGSSLPLLQDMNLQFDKNGNVNISR